MFNVSALLMDDALKSATPLTNGAEEEELYLFIVLTFTLCLFICNGVVACSGLTV